MATLTLSSLFTFLDLFGVTADHEKLPIVRLRVESFPSLDHGGQELRRSRFSFKLLSHDHRSFRVDKGSTLRKGGAGDVVQIDRTKDGLMDGIFLQFLFTDITVSNNKRSTSGGCLINRHDNWLHVGFTPGSVWRNQLQRSCFF